MAITPILIALIGIASAANGPLSQNMKLSAMRLKASEDIAASKYAFKESSSNPTLTQDDPPPFKFYVKPFTASPYYDFFDSFLLGLKLETFFKGSESCLMDIVYTVDDMFYLYNNISDFKWKSLEAPFMNFTKAVSGNFSSALVDCAVMGQSAYTYAVNKYS